MIISNFKNSQNINHLVFNKLGLQKNKFYTISEINNLLINQDGFD